MSTTTLPRPLQTPSLPNRVYGHLRGLICERSEDATWVRPARTQSTTSSAFVKALKLNSHKYRWVAAVSGSRVAASLELATGGAPVMATGGFDGQGGNLTITQFKQYVVHRQIRYYIAGGTDGGGSLSGAPPMASSGRPARGRGSFTGAHPGGGSTSGSQIASWVKARDKSQTISDQTVYKLTQPRG